MDIIKNIVDNPMTRWLMFFLNRIRLEKKHKDINLKIGYMSRVNNCHFGEFNTIYEDVTLNNVSLGCFTYIANDTRIFNAEIGKFCSVGSEVRCGLGIHPTQIFVSTHPIFFSTKKQAQITFVKKDYIKEYKRIKIGNDVWIGNGAVIIDGVIIGNGAIIAAGSVVTKDVEPYSIVGGVPAKVIRYRFSEDQIRFLQKVKWWDMDIDWIKSNHLKFNNVEDLISLINDNEKK